MLCSLQNKYKHNKRDKNSIHSNIKIDTKKIPTLNRISKKKKEKKSIWFGSSMTDVGSNSSCQVALLPLFQETAAIPRAQIQNKCENRKRLWKSVSIVNVIIADGHKVTLLQ